MTIVSRDQAVAEPITSPPLLSEGPLWDFVHERLLWVEIAGHLLHSYDPKTASEVTVRFNADTAAVALVADWDGYLVAVGRTILLFDLTSRRVSHVADLDSGVRANDGAVDQAGRYLIGTMDPQNHGGASLYQIESGRVRRVLEDVTISNGLDWSPDGSTMYYVDTPLERVDAFDYDLKTGSLSRRRVFVDLSSVPGRPDGLTVDAEGGVWVAMAFGGSALRRFMPDAKPDRVIELPVPNVTSVAFGGAGMTDLYVTTSRLRMTAEDLIRQPRAGAVFRISDVGVVGRPANTYRR